MYFQLVVMYLRTYDIVPISIIIYTLLFLFYSTHTYIVYLVRIFQKKELEETARGRR